MATKIRASNLHTDVKTMVTTMVGENALDSAEANLLIDAKFTANSTDVLSEGSTNLYFTNARADARAQLKVDAIVGSAPGTLDTLQEIGDALGDDPNFATTVTNSIATKLPLAGGTLTGNLSFGDDDKAIFGAGSDLQLYHNSTNNHSYISEVGSGSLVLTTNGSTISINTDGPENMAVFRKDSSVDLFHNNSKKFETSATGIDVTGTVTADGLTVDGIVTISSQTPKLRFFETDQTDEGTLLRSAGDSFQIAKMLDTGAVDGIRIRVDQSSGDISFYEDTGTTAKFHWDASAESLGIGVTPIVPLDVVTGSNQRILFNNTNGSPIISAVNKANTAYLPLQLNGSDVRLKVSGTERMRINSSGNVGIGTSSPLGKVTIANAAGANAPTTVTAANTYLQLGSDDFGASNNGKFMIGFGYTDATNTNSPAYIGYEEVSNSGDTYGDLTFYTRSVTTDTAPSERMRIDSSGKVGIGESSPLGKLHIKNGDSGATVDVGADELVVESNTHSGITILSGQSYSGSIYFGDAGVNYDGFVTYGQSTRSMVFGTAAGTRMTIDSSGRVGIGRTSPQSKLDILSSARVTSAANAGHSLKLEARNDFANDGDSSLIWISDGGLGSNPLFSGQGAHLVIEGRKSTSRHIYFKVGDTTTAQHVMLANGYVGIGTISPSERLEVSGNILASGNITAYSDISLKDNITPIPDALDKVLQLRGVTYNRNDIEDNPRHTGVIAQEVEKVLPEVISENEDGIKSVAYGNMVGLLVEAIKELKAEIEELKGK